MCLHFDPSFMEQTYFEPLNVEVKIKVVVALRELSVKRGEKHTCKQMSKSVIQLDVKGCMLQRETP